MYGIDKVKLFFSTFTFVETIIRGDGFRIVHYRSSVSPCPVINLPPNNALAEVAPPVVQPLHSPMLEAFITNKRKAAIRNSELSVEHDAEAVGLCCTILLDFPLIPVRFNGRLYDFDALMRIVVDRYIQDPVTRERIQLVPHVIQPDFTAQERMDIMLMDSKKKKIEASPNSTSQLQMFQRSRLPSFGHPQVIADVESKEENLSVFRLS